MHCCCGLVIPPFQVIMATNRADTLDPALLRPGRLDRKIEFPVPDRRQKRMVFTACTAKMNLSEVTTAVCTCVGGTNGRGLRLSLHRRWPAVPDTFDTIRCKVRSLYHPLLKFAVMWRILLVEVVVLTLSFVTCLTFITGSGPGGLRE